MKLATISMLYLICSLSIIVPASGLSATIHGEDNIDGFRRVNDTTTITAFSDTGNVQLLGNEPIALSCSPAAAGFTCSHSFPVNTQSSGRYSLTLRDESGDVSVPYNVDGNPPRFTQSTFSLVDGRLSARYTIEEVSCSSLDMLELVVDESVVATEQLQGCTASGVIRGDVGQYTGTAGVYLAARDALGNLGTSQRREVLIDTVPPQLSSSFTISRFGNALERRGSSLEGVTVSFTISELQLRSVRVTFPDGTVRTASCSSDEVSECVVNNARFDDELEITIGATDAAGNTAEGVATAELELLEQGPRILYIGRPSRCTDCFLSTGGNNILVEVDAPGGLHGDGIFLDTGARIPTTCVQDNVTWACTGVVTTNGPLTLAVAPESMDDLGNQIQNPLSRSFGYDTTSPEIIGQPMMDSSCPAAGQQVTLTAQVRDESPVTITANTSAVTDTDAFTEQCVSQDGLQECILVLEGFIPVHDVATIPLLVADAAGNTVEMQINIEICQPEADATPNHIRSLTVANPPSVNKRIASLIPFTVRVPFNADVVGGTILGARDISCVNQEVTDAYIVDNDLVVSLYYPNVWPETLLLNCSIDFAMRRGNLAYLQPETETLAVQLPLFGEEIGSWSDATRAREELLVEEINDLQKGINTLAAWDASLGQFCSIAEMLGKANAALSAVKQLLMGIAMAIPFGGWAIWAKGQIPLSKFHSVVNTFVWPIGWFSGGSDLGGGSVGAAQAFGNGIGLSSIGYLVKWTCGFYHCKIYDVSTVAQMGLETGQMNRFLDSVAGTDEEWAHALGTDSVAVISEDGNIMSVSYQDGGLGMSGRVDSLEISAESDPAADSMYLENVIEYWKERQRMASTGENIYNERLKKAFLSQQPETPNRPSFTFTQSEIVSYDWPQSDLSSAQRAQFSQAVVGEAGDRALIGDTWIVNPYRSTKYDAMCFPAQLYNKRKEKQLKCMQLDCVRDMANAGLPTTTCDEQHATLSCLYLEGAESRRHGNIMGKFFKQVGRIAMQMAIGYAVQKGFRAMCGPVYSIFDWAPEDLAATGACSLKGEPGIIQWSMPHCALNSVACGITGSYFQFQELRDFAQNPYSSMNTVPAGDDMCEGIQGVTGDTSVGGPQ